MGCLDRLGQTDSLTAEEESFLLRSRTHSSRRVVSQQEHMSALPRSTAGEEPATTNHIKEQKTNL
jgi:hypothetical protein